MSVFVTSCYHSWGLAPRHFGICSLPASSILKPFPPFPEVPGFPATMLLILAWFSIFPLLPPCSLFIWFFFCLLSDSFSGTNPYRNTALFQSEPPALAGLFRGTYTGVKMGNHLHQFSFWAEQFCEFCFCAVFFFDFWGSNCSATDLLILLLLYVQHSFFYSEKRSKTQCNIKKKE